MAWHKINQDEKQRVKHQARCNLRKSDRTKDCTHSFLGKRKLSKSKKSWSETQEQLQIHDGGEGVGVFITKTIFSPPVIANSVCMLSKFLHQQSVKMTTVCRWLFPVRPRSRTIDNLFLYESPWTRTLHSSSNRSRTPILASMRLMQGWLS